MSSREILEQLSGFTMLDTIKNESLHPLVLQSVERLINSRQFNQETFNKMQGLFLGRGYNVECYVYDRIKEKKLKWVDGCLVPDIARIEILLSKAQEEAIRNIVIRTKNAPELIISEILDSALRINCHEERK